MRLLRWRFGFLTACFRGASVFTSAISIQLDRALMRALPSRIGCLVMKSVEIFLRSGTTRRVIEKKDPGWDLFCRGTSRFGSNRAVDLRRIRDHSHCESG